MPHPRRAPSIYSVHPAIAHVQAILRNLEQNTGKDLDAWVAQVQRQGPPEEKGRRAWLGLQGLGGAQARLVAECSMGAGTHAFHDTAEGYLARAPVLVERQYEGPKAALRPLYEALLALARELGPDVKVCPCETLVPLYRRHVFAQIKASTRSRVDLALALGDPAQVADPKGRLIDTGGFRKQDRLTHRIEVQAAADLDGDLRAWLRRAYDRDRG